MQHPSICDATARRYSASLVATMLMLGTHASPASAALDPDRAKPAHLFATSEDAANGRCFPKYYLELWRDDDQLRQLIWRGDQSPGANPQCDVAALDWRRLRDYFRSKHGSSTTEGAWSPPRLAVTLEGGGSKSAPFSMGALAGLHESGLLEDVDLISTVSGGSYAGYFYFSRLLDAHAGTGQAGFRNPDAWFADCVPSIYYSRFGRSVANQIRFCSGAEWIPDTIEKFAKDYPFQAHVRYYQDVVHWKGGLERVGEDVADTVSTFTNVGALLAQHLLTVPVHTVMNSLFAMPESTSPSRFAYRAGIERAYAHTLTSWNGASAGGPERAGGEFTERVYQRRYAMRDLAPLVGSDPCGADGRSCRVPNWIANSAASSGRDLTNWLSVPNTDALRASYEMSPFGQGSGLYGFVSQPVALPLRDVVGSSAAFLDREQREFGLGLARFAAGGAISLFNLEWGSDIPNVNVSDTAREASHITPFPLYHVPAARQRHSPTIHLADGGNTDNLGVLAALRRGAKNVVVVAATGDGSGRMRSLCRAKNHLELDGVYRLDMPELNRIDEVCSEQIGERERVVWGPDAISKLVCDRRKITAHCEMFDGTWHWVPQQGGALGYDMWDWPIPVLTGSVLRDKIEGPGVERISNIYLVKPAFYSRAAREQLSHVSDKSTPDRLCGLGDNIKINQCTSSTYRRFDKVSQVSRPALPCTALAFATANSCRTGSKDGTFPQHDVVFTTLNSSYTLFSAYFDLARHVVSQLTWSSDDHDSLQVPRPLAPLRTALCPTQQGNAEAPVSSCN